MINVELLSKLYFWFDKPVPYKIKNQEILIYPINLKDSELFLACVDILSIDKNALPDPNYISMSYLDFIVKTFVLNEEKEISDLAKDKLANLFNLCLNWKIDDVIFQFDGHKYKLYYQDFVINYSQFEDIRRIILYQNLIDFDDTYINPDVKKAIMEYEAIKMKNIEIPNIERKMAIITAHTGISKKEQMEMTYRSHCALFKEVYGEVDYSTIRTAFLVNSMFSEKKNNELEDWIYKKKHNKYEKYFTSAEQYNNSMGGKIAINSVTQNIKEEIL